MWYKNNECMIQNPIYRWDIGWASLGGLSVDKNRQGKQPCNWIGGTVVSLQQFTTLIIAKMLLNLCADEWVTKHLNP